MMTFDEFVEKLYACGWRSTLDAEHYEVEFLWEELQRESKIATERAIGILRHNSNIGFETGVQELTKS